MVVSSPRQALSTATAGAQAIACPSPFTPSPEEVERDKEAWWSSREKSEALGSDITKLKHTRYTK